MTLSSMQTKLRDEGAAPAAGTFIMLLDNGKKVICQWIDVWLGAFTTHEIPGSAFYVNDFRDHDVIPLMEMKKEKVKA